LCHAAENARAYIRGSTGPFDIIWRLGKEEETLTVAALAFTHVRPVDPEREE
jgi:hypothetical protein